MKFLFILLLIAGNATGGWYFSSGRVALGLGIAVASWIIFAFINGLLQRSNSVVNDGSSDSQNLPTEVPLDQVFSPPMASTQQAASFPDITDDDAATADSHGITARKQAIAAQPEEESSPQKGLF
jgi:hypothetical protein